MNVAGLMSVTRLLVATIALAGTTLATEALAQAAGSAPAADSPSAGAASRRLVARDIEPVYRGGTIDTLATIRKRGVLRVGVAMSEPTVMHDADGKLVGFSIDAARRLADDLGVGLEFVETSWSGIIPDLLSSTSRPRPRSKASTSSRAGRRPRA
jgi:polar amino acid transport system substrate-binding protein